MTIRISAVDREEASRAPQTAQLFWLYCPLEQHGEPQSVWVGMGLAHYMRLWVSNTREKESLLIPLAYHSEKPTDLACTPLPPLRHRETHWLTWTQTWDRQGRTVSLPFEPLCSIIISLDLWIALLHHFKSHYCVLFCPNTPPFMVVACEMSEFQQLHIINNRIIAHRKRKSRLLLFSW